MWLMESRSLRATVLLQGTNEVQLLLNAVVRQFCPATSQRCLVQDSMLSKPDSTCFDQCPDGSLVNPVDLQMILGACSCLRQALPPELASISIPQSPSWIIVSEPWSCISRNSVSPPEPLTLTRQSLLPVWPPSSCDLDGCACRRFLISICKILMLSSRMMDPPLICLLATAALWELVSDQKPKVLRTKRSACPCPTNVCPHVSSKSGLTVPGAVVALGLATKSAPSGSLPALLALPGPRARATTRSFSARLSGNSC